MPNLLRFRHIPYGVIIGVWQNLRAQGETLPAGVICQEDAKRSGGAQGCGCGSAYGRLNDQIADDRTDELLAFTETSCLR